MTKEELEKATALYSKLTFAQNTLEGVKTAFDQGAFVLCVKTPHPLVMGDHTVEIPEEVGKAVSSAIWGAMVRHVEKLQKEFDEI